MTVVLVVDDSSMDRRLAGAILGKAGHDVTYANDGREALASIRAKRPDLVLTDLTMPEMTGLELVTAVRREFPSLPVILMTAHGSEQIAVLALKTGATSFVPKRRLASELASTVQGILTISTDLERRSTVDPLEVREMNYSIPPDLEALGEVVGQLEAQLLQMGLCDEAMTLQVAVAIREALVNAMVHGNLEVSSDLLEKEPSCFGETIEARRFESPYKDRVVRVRAVYFKDEVTYVVTDEGPGFDPSSLPDPTDLANLEKPSGRGLMLIRMFMDEVAFNPTGNEIRMTKRRSSAAV